MVTVPWPDWVERASPYAEALRPQYIGALCSFRREYPWLWAALNRALNPVGAGYQVPLNNWVLDNVCPPIIPPQSPVYGGQCDVPYDGIGRAFEEDGSPAGITIVSVVPGPITGVETRIVQRTAQSEGAEFRIRSALGQWTPWEGISDRPPGVLAEITVELRRTDGLPDTCGDRVPFPVPVTPPSFPVTVPIVIGNQQFPISINLPSFDSGDWPDFSFEPTIEIGEVPITISPEGITFPDEIFPPFPEIPAPNVNLAPAITAIADLGSLLTGEIGGLEIALEALRGSEEVDLTEVIELIRRCCCGEGKTKESYTIATNTNGGVFPLDAKTFAVVVSVTPPFTPATPTQAGSGSAPDVYHWGWWSIGYGDTSPGVRIPLQHSVQSLQVGEGAVSVAVSPHYQNRCTIIGVKTLEERP